jgi:hypothetical protein
VADTDPTAAIEARIAQLDAEIREREAERERCRAALGMLRGLTVGQQSGNLAKQMPAMLSVNRLRRSRTVAEKNADPCAKAANAKGMTMSDLAMALGVTPSYLSQIRHEKKPITQERANEIEKLTGFKATKKNWPTLVLSKPE